MFVCVNDLRPSKNFFQSSWDVFLKTVMFGRFSLFNSYKQMIIEGRLAIFCISFSNSDQMF